MKIIANKCAIFAKSLIIAVFGFNCKWGIRGSLKAKIEEKFPQKILLNNLMESIYIHIYIYVPKCEETQKKTEISTITAKDH